ncbi:MAG: V-type ATP synthase subunit E [Candidatus Thorarchaeota archaeon]
MNGIDNIIEMINKKTQDRVDTIIKRAEDYKAKKLKSAKEEAKQIRARIEAKARREAQTIIKRYEANAKLKAKQQILRAKDECITSIMNEVLAQATDLAGKKEFEPVLKRMIIDAGIALASPELELVVPESIKMTLDLAELVKDIEKTAGKKTKLSIAKEHAQASGGVIIRTKDGNMWVDNTIEARYERLQSAIRDKIASILFTERE